MKWYDRGCTEIHRVAHYPIYNTYYGIEQLPQGEAIHGSFRVGGNPFSEHYWYTWQHGFVKWEYWKDGESKPRHISDFSEVRPRVSEYDFACYR